MARFWAMYVIGVAIAVGGAGCGLQDPYAGEDRAGETRERPASTASVTAARDPAEAVRRLALAWSNWTTRTVHDQHRQAIALTTGEAALRLTSESRQLEASIRALPRSVRSRATVEAVTVSGAGGRRSAIVVTRENLAGAGPLGSAGEYKVTLATVERRGPGWAISRWVREP